MELFQDSPAIKQAVNILVLVFIGYYVFVKRNSTNPEIRKLEERRFNQMLWVGYTIPAIIIVSFPVFIFLYPNELDLIGERVQGVLLHSFRILLIPILLINLNFYLKKRKLKREAAANRNNGDE